MLEALTSSSGIAGRLTEVISVDRVKMYKPEGACYALVEPALRVTKEEVLFISSNGFDVAGAKRYGFQVAWIERAGTVAPPKNSLVGPGEFFRLVRGGAEQLSYEADFHLTSLNDLVALVST